MLRYFFPIVYLFTFIVVLYTVYKEPVKEKKKEEIFKAFTIKQKALIKKIDDAIANKDEKKEQQMTEDIYSDLKELSFEETQKLMAILEKSKIENFKQHGTTEENPT